MNGSTPSSARPTNAPSLAEAATAPVRFTLTGPSRSYDPLHQAIRRDLADVAEAKHHFAPHYAEPVICVAVSQADVRAQPQGDADMLVSLASGARFALLDLTGGWAWGYAVDGHIVGYVRRELLEIA